MGIRFRKSFKAGPVRVNLSKSGVSTTVGGKGASVNVGGKGAYLNTGISGTGIYNRTKIGSGNKNTREENGIGSNTGSADDSFAININDIDESQSIPPCPKNKIAIHIVLLVLFFWTFGIANLLYFIGIKGKQKQWRELVNRHNILEQKIKAIKQNELFLDAKVFVIDINNIIAFSEKGYIALWTDKHNDEMKVFETNGIQKINQEIRSGECYAHIYTNDFNDNVVSLFLGHSYSAEEKENIKKLYNEIKSLYTTLKRKN
jgi:hypothetical protein